MHRKEPARQAARADAASAVVVGGGISGLVAARDLAISGASVTVLEASDRWGGCVGSHTVAGLTLDSGAESFATRSTAVPVLAAELGLSSRIVTPRPGGAWVQLPEGPRELPKTGVLGIPANPWDPEVRRTLGLLGSLRASVDRWLPATVGTASEVTSVSALVRARMGTRVLERLVAPVVGGVHSADPGLLDVDMVAPGLRDGLRRLGSLAAAVAAQRGRSVAPAAVASQVDGQPEEPSVGAAQTGRQAGGAELRDRGAAKAGSAVAGLAGGMYSLVEALVADLEARGVSLHAGTKADAVRQTPGGWSVTAAGKSFDASRLVVALDGPAAVALLEPALPDLVGLRPEAGPDVRLVTLVVDLPELDQRPRGTGILVAPQSPGITAKALTHATGKWSWLADEAGPGTHVLRLSYGRAGLPDAKRKRSEKQNRKSQNRESPDRESPDREPRDRESQDSELFESALTDASALLGVAVGRDDVLDWDVVRWTAALPFAAVGHKRRVAEIRRICSETSGLAVVGGWLAGNGLAAVVADARTQIAELAKGA